ncbi:unnamed protein product [Rhizoctonia solani]|uniref:Uncharacterized protein n=1 Tax=Rhizoctonia solani TaxID=456999 RepID=A0A8H3GX37_9AGAM|nr:unnamed protein product [Rhizoctonia solani]
MAGLPPIPVQISQPGEQLLTMQTNLVDEPITLINAAGKPGEQEWVPENGGLKNLQFGLFAGVQGRPEVGSRVVAVRVPFPWVAEPVDGPNRYYIFTECDGQKLYLEPSPLKIWPPMVTLADRPQAPWELRGLE